ncbi:hypothetical protein G5I_00665 [Acromyrmex echinatior]|uniref:Uncharacterized protein n=1 Tax=Acromyrmex echinatior TaxID=103372 RepID=F4W5G8_ACREC|nr:hypothetical protein G5I_00665 [Acromyrmex echinatior]
MRWPLTENQCTAALLMVVEGNTLYEREWSRAELIGSSRTFQRGNDSVCTDPSFTSKSNPWLYNRKSFQPLLTAFFFPLCCNLFARMGNPAYVRLVTRRTVEEIGSHTVLHTYCVSRNTGVTLCGGNDRVGYGVQQPYDSSNLPWVRLGTPKKAEVGRQAGKHAVVVLGAA